MSGFIGTPSGVGLGQWLVQDDIRLWENHADITITRWIHIHEPWHYQGFTTGWWPGLAGFTDSGDSWIQPVWWQQPEHYTGAVARMAFTGVTRDVYGSILGGCVVKLFKTANGTYPGTKDAKIDEITSDATTGEFTVYSQYYPDTHYLVSYKTGVPDVEGTTVNTLIGA